MRWLLLVCIGGMCWGGCALLEPDTPSIPDSTLVEVLVELHLAAARQEQVGDVPAQFMDSVLQAYQVDSLAFKARMQQLAAHPQEAMQVYERVLERLQEEYPRGATDSLP